MIKRSDSVAKNGPPARTLTAGRDAAGRTLATEYRSPRDLLRACVSAGRVVAHAEAVAADAERALDAAIERRVDLEEAIALMLEAAGKEAVTFYDGPDYWVATKTGGSTCLTPAAHPTSLSLGALLPTTPAPASSSPDGISDEEFEDMVSQVEGLALADLSLHPFARLVRSIPDDRDAIVASFALPDDIDEDRSPGPGYSDDDATGEFPTLAALGLEVAVIDQEAG